jgi:hypothetical protein
MEGNYWWDANINRMILIDVALPFLTLSSVEAIAVLNSLLWSMSKKKRLWG